MTEVRRPAPMYLYPPQGQEPLDAEGLSWLADQLCSDTRVHPDRTMAIGWITSQAAYEYPALLDELTATRAALGSLIEAVERHMEWLNNLPQHDNRAPCANGRN
ncbi:MAG: hypothetical protein HC788_04860 [Sphingopyxis sp.]|nr:hypothetical protein [Sphingopyxis sp.]